MDIDVKKLNDEELLRLDPYKNPDGTLRPGKEFAEIYSAQTLVRKRLQSLHSPAASAGNPSAAESARRVAEYFTSFESPVNFDPSLPVCVFDDTESNRQFPSGGTNGFSSVIGPMIEKYLGPLTDMFGPALAKRLAIQWNPHVGANQSSAHSLMQTKRIAPDGDKQEKAYCRGSKMLMFGGALVPGHLDARTRHELTHAFMHECLPHDAAMQEMAALIGEKVLSDTATDDGIPNPCDSSDISILTGDTAFHIPEHAGIAIDESLSRLWFGAQCQEILRMAGNKDQLVKMLQAGKRAAMEKPVNQETGVEMPSMAEWLRICDTVDTSFSAKYQASSLMRPVQEGPVVFSALHPKWGAVIGMGMLTLLPGYEQEKSDFTKSSPAYAKLEAGRGMVRFHFGDKVKQASFNGMARINPQNIAHAYKALHPHSTTTVPMGTNVEVEIEGVEKRLLFTWNEAAEDMLHKIS